VAVEQRSVEEELSVAKESFELPVEVFSRWRG
jgi:hypothetical protein